MLRGFFLSKISIIAIKVIMQKNANCFCLSMTLRVLLDIGRSWMDVEAGDTLSAMHGDQRHHFTLPKSQ